jgi:phosphatidylinositol glycan class Q protein
MLGTILFTLLFFLLPTVFVFYLTFASARMVIITIKALLDTQLAFLNHFPLFALMLRVKDSRRLPGGIYFDLQPGPDASLPIIAGHDRPQGPSASTSHIIVRSIPLPLQHMFHEYFQLGSQIQSHYLLPGVFLRLITGRFVPPMHRKNLYSLQYSMLPAVRVGVSDLWRRLQEANAKAAVDRKGERVARKASLKAFGNGVGNGLLVRKRSWGLDRRRARQS